MNLLIRTVDLFIESRVCFQTFTTLIPQTRPPSSLLPRYFQERRRAATENKRAPGKVENCSGALRTLGVGSQMGGRLQYLKVGHACFLVRRF